MKLAGLGVFDDEKHSSLAYCEEHAEEVFADGGVKFFKQLEDATKKGKCLRKWKDDLKMKKIQMKNEMETLKKDGAGRESQMRLFQRYSNECSAMLEERMDREGIPLDPNLIKKPWLGTIVDDELFKPSPPPPDCPICFLGLPKRVCCTYQPCCGTVSKSV